MQTVQKQCQETAQKFGEEDAVDNNNGNNVVLRDDQEEFLKHTVPKFFGLPNDKPEDKMSKDKMANLSMVFAGRARIQDLLRKIQYLILASHWEQ